MPYWTAAFQVPCSSKVLTQTGLTVTTIQYPSKVQILALLELHTTIHSFSDITYHISYISYQKHFHKTQLIHSNSFIIN